MVKYMYYVNIFFIYSMIGFLFEGIISLVKNKKFNSGILYGPWTPIYGVGCLLIIFISKYIFKNLVLDKWLEILIVITTVTFILTIIEWITGNLIEKIFHVVFWNYRKFKYNIGKYIALEVSFVWMIGSVIVIYILHPLISRFTLYIPEFISIIFTILFIIDIMVVFFTKKVNK